ncbi:unnamed protein product [Parajaminaea phylloscopi]
MISILTSLIAAGTVGFLWTWRHSLPLSWTVRLFFVQLRNRYVAGAPADGSKGKVTRSEPHLLLSRLPEPGTDIFDDVFTSSPFTATIDECDFNFHLSNSSYPRAFDQARVECGSRQFLRGQLDGSWIALGGTSFRFLKEIPMGSTYWIRISVVTWDEKWAYIKGEFVTRPRTRSGQGKKADTSTDYVVNCVALAKICIKSGRKTIPPWLFFAANGYAPSGSQDASSNWERAEDLRVRLLSEARQAARSRGKADVKRDSFLAGRGYSRAAGIFTRYLPAVTASAPSGSTDRETKQGQDTREAWMEKAYWNVEGWEKECLQGREQLNSLSLASI